MTTGAILMASGRVPITLKILIIVFAFQVEVVAVSARVHSTRGLGPWTALELMGRKCSTQPPGKAAISLSVLRGAVWSRGETQYRGARR